MPAPSVHLIRQIALPDPLVKAIGYVNDPMHGLPPRDAFRATHLIAAGYLRLMEGDAPLALDAEQYDWIITVLAAQDGLHSTNLTGAWKATGILRATEWMRREIP